MAFMFRDFDETVRHGDHLPCVTDSGSGDLRLPPEPTIVSLPWQCASGIAPDAHDNTLHNQQVSAAALIQRDSQQVPASSVDNIRTNGVRLGVSELVHAAIHDTDFVHDLTDDQHLLQAAVENAVDMAADIWSDAHEYEPVPLDTIIAARAALLAEAQDMLVDRAEMAQQQLRDEIEAGDRDRHGRFIPFPRYFGVMP
jgi:hypothetical protein